MAEPAKTIEPAKKPAARTPLRLVPPSELFRRVENMTEQIAQRAFDIFERDGRVFGREVANWLQAESELLHPVHVDISEKENELAVRAEVPGFAADQLEISVEGNRLTISGKREAHEERKDATTVYREHCSDQILRVVELPASIDATQAAATLKDGILELKLPKALPSKKIAIAAKAT